MSPSEEEFQAWRDHPVTQWVFSACRVAAEDARELWIAQSWVAGKADQDALTELRARAATYLDLVQMSRDDVAAAFGEPE